MREKYGIGWWGFILAMALAVVMCLVAYLLRPVEISPTQTGVCLGSPDSWEIDSFVSWIINTVLIGLISVLLYLINKRYNIIKTTDPALPALFLIMAASNTWLTQGINTSTLLCFVNIVGLGIIFGTYDIKNATPQLFILGLAIGLGSMVQYAFVLMIGVFVLWALFMKVLRIKETLAFMAGLICPYWVSLGLEIVHLSDFHFPSMIPFFNTTQDQAEIFFLLASVGMAAIIGILITLASIVKIYSGNSKIQAMNFCIITLGVASLLCVLVDYENLPAYVMSLYLAISIQITNTGVLWNVRNRWLVTVLPAVLYMALFAGSVWL